VAASAAYQYRTKQLIWQYQYNGNNINVMTVSASGIGGVKSSNLLVVGVMALCGIEMMTILELIVNVVARKLIDGVIRRSNLFYFCVIHLKHIRLAAWLRVCGVAINGHLKAASAVRKPKMTATYCQLKAAKCVSYYSLS
jgi:hypothetical protein